MSNVFDALQVSDQYRGDVSRLREAVPLLQSLRFSDYEIERLYERFSDSYCAGWLCLDDETIQNFTDWLSR